jgi:hypothetical protein
MIIDKRQLKTPIACGGEAEIYDGDTPNTVFKVFQKHIDLKAKHRKVQALMAHDWAASRVVAPLDVLTDKSGAFIGYKMARVADAEALHQFAKTKFCNLKKITNLDVFKILCAVGEEVQSKIHATNAVIGDLNDHNVIVKTGERDLSRAVFFIDVDSWGVDGLPPDAYTDGFVPSEAYGKKMALTALTDNFSYNVIAFNLLTHLHPFSGVWQGHDNLSIVDRLHKGASVLGKYKKEITIPKIIQPWTWMSPELQGAFKASFEDGRRETVYEIIRDQMQNYRYCTAHNTYYYDKYGTCPLCSGTAKVAVAVKKISTGQFIVTELFSADDVDFFLDFDKYVSTATSFMVKHIPSGKECNKISRAKVEFTFDGKNTCLFYDDKIVIDGDNAAEIPRLYKSQYQMGKNTIYYIDPDGQLIELKLTKAGNVRQVILPTYNALFCADGYWDEIFVLQRYRHVSMITLFFANQTTKSTGVKASVTLELPPVGRIDEYFIQQDKMNGQWVFIYKTNNGLFRTLLIDKNLHPTGIWFDSASIRYTAESLDNMCFINSTVYDVGDGKIVANALTKNITKEFPCAEITESGKLRYVDGHFEFIGGNKIYKMEAV